MHVKIRASFKYFFTLTVFLKNPSLKFILKIECTKTIFKVPAYRISIYLPGLNA